MTRAIRLSVAAGCAACCAMPAIAGNPDRAYQRELLADADARTSLLQLEESLSGQIDIVGMWGEDRDSYGFGFSDGDKKLGIGGLQQFRYVWNSRDGDTSPGANDETTIGFQNRQTRLDFGGQLDADNGFRIAIKMGPDGMAELSRAYIVHRYDENGSIIAGQFQDGFMHEGMVESENQLGIERGILSSYFNVRAVQGIGYQRVMNDRWRVFVSFNDGHSSSNTDFDQEEVDWGFSGRLEYIVTEDTPDFGRFQRYSSERGSNYATLIGTGLHLQDGGDTNGSMDIGSLWWTIDATAQGDGWNAGGAFALLHEDDSTAPDEYLDFGFRIFGGYFLTDTTEAFAAWDSVIPDGDRPTDETINALNFGVHYYPIEGNRTTRFSGDVQIFMGEPAMSIVSPSTTRAFLNSAEDTQFAFRAQAQLLF